MSQRRKCFIPSCPNSGSKTRDRLLVRVNDFLKRKWCKQIKIVYNPEQKLYCCEDHLDLNEDLENYYQWKFMNATPRLKSTATLKYSLENMSSCAIPTENQSGGVEVETIRVPSQLRELLLQPTENIPSRSNKGPSTASTCAGLVHIDVATQCNIQLKMVDKSTLVKKHGSKSEPLVKTDIESTSTTTASVSPSMYGSTSETDVYDSDLPANIEKHKSNRINMINLICKKPQMYLGLPKQYLWVITEIATVLSGKELDILIALFKIRFNDPMVRLADQFELSRPKISTSFYNGLTLLANYFQHFVFMPSPAEIKQNLPLAFKINYSNVQCILDAFEIEIEKPSNPQAQSRTWSQYKHCNTLKYLVGCTPNGFISYISKGWGGRISDKKLVEISNLIDLLPTNAIIMADRGFKEIETLLATKNITLLRPPSVYSSTKPTKQEVLETKVIASLRVHVERVIRRIREFRLLKPHSVVSYKHVGYIDQVALVSCGLINLQNEIIKR